METDGAGYPSVGSFLLNACKIVAGTVRIHAVAVAARFLKSDNRQVGKKQKTSVRKWQYRILALARIGKRWSGEGDGGVARRNGHFVRQKR